MACFPNKNLSLGEKSLLDNFVSRLGKIFRSLVILCVSYLFRQLKRKNIYFLRKALIVPLISIFQQVPSEYRQFSDVRTSCLEVRTCWVWTILCLLCVRSLGGNLE